MNDILKTILKDKEERYNKQAIFIAEYNCNLICLTLNIPGSIKIKKEYLDFHSKQSQSLIEYLQNYGFNILHSEIFIQQSAMCCFVCIDGNSSDLKRRCINFESSPWGRVLDVDVYNNQHIAVTRESLGIAPRTCFLCKKNAAECIIKKTHSLDLLIQKVNELIEKYYNSNNR